MNHEPVTAKALYQRFYETLPAARYHSEWVMDEGTYRRVRLLTDPAGSPLLMMMPGVDVDNPGYLLGLPVAIDPGAEWGLRPRRDHAVRNSAP